MPENERLRLISFTDSFVDALLVCRKPSEFWLAEEILILRMVLIHGLCTHSLANARIHDFLPNENAMWIHNRGRRYCKLLDNKTCSFLKSFYAFRKDFWIEGFEGRKPSWKALGRRWLKHTSWPIRSGWRASHYSIYKNKGMTEYARFVGFLRTSDAKKYLFRSVRIKDYTPIAPKIKTGDRFFHLVAIKQHGWSWHRTKQHPNKRKRKWLFQCDCGRIVELQPAKVRSGHTKSCGCKNKVSIEGVFYGSYVEASLAVEYHDKGISFVHNKTYPGKQWRFDFYIPSQNKYVEVTGFDESFHKWDEYRKKIERKKLYVETVLHASFEFVQRTDADAAMRSLSGRIDTNCVGFSQGESINKCKSADWTKKNSVIANELGVKVTHVKRARSLFSNGVKWTRTRITKREACKKAEQKRQQQKLFWSSIDWDMSNNEIAKTTRHCEKTIKRFRSKYGHPSKYFYINQKLRLEAINEKTVIRPDYVNWKSVDWSLNNGKISRIYHRSLSVVRKARERHSNRLKEDVLFPECLV